MKVICAGMSDIGRKRSTNQDAIYINNDEKLYIVADGMGGHSGGELASTMAIKYMSEYFKAILKKEASPTSKIKNCIGFANKKIKNFADSDKKLQGMGTTVVSLFFEDENLAIGNVGDSRAYLVQDEQLFQISKDHSMVQEKINMGIYTRKQAQDDPQKNILSRTVGFEDDIQIDAFSYNCKPGDYFLICSDGLHGKVSDHDILALLKTHLLSKESNYSNIRDAVQALVRQANINGGQDNISLVIAAVQ